METTDPASEEANLARLRAHLRTTDPATRAQPASAPVLVVIRCPDCLKRGRVDNTCHCGGFGSVLVDREFLSGWTP